MRSLIHAGAENSTTWMYKRYNKDATSSGLQLIGKVINDRPLAKRTNLIGSKYTDMYDEGTKGFLAKMNNHSQTFNEFCKLIFDEITPNFDTDEKHPIKLLLGCETDEDFDKLFEKLRSKIEPHIVFQLLNFHFPVTNLTPELKLKNKASALYETLYKAREYHLHKELLKKIPPQIFSRKLFKVVVMALGYS